MSINRLHRDCHKCHGFCEKKEPQNPCPLCQPVKRALGTQEKSKFTLLGFSVEMNTISGNIRSKANRLSASSMSRDSSQVYRLNG